MSQLTTTSFTEIVQLIAAAKQQAIKAVNTSLIDLYWQVGEIISRKIASAEWVDGVVNQLAEHIAQTQPGLRGLPGPTCSACGSFTKLIRTKQKSHHW
jgi:hypothetical protein